MLVIKNEISFRAKIVGLDLLNVNSTSTESYKNGKLIKFKSNTIQNKKKKYNYSVFSNDKKIYDIRGSSFKGEAPSSAVIGNWWNHNILQSKIIISPLSGSLRFQEVYFLSKEILKIDKDIYETSKFKIELKKNADDFSDGAGQQYPHSSLYGDLRVKELFTEVYLPLETDTNFNLSIRYSDYSLEENSLTYDIGLVQLFQEKYTLKFSQQKAIRMPDINDLYSPAKVNQAFLNSDQNIRDEINITH